MRVYYMLQKGRLAERELTCVMGQLDWMEWNSSTWNFWQQPKTINDDQGGRNRRLALIQRFYMRIYLIGRGRANCYSALARSVKKASICLLQVDYHHNETSSWKKGGGDELSLRQKHSSAIITSRSRRICTSASFRAQLLSCLYSAG